MSHLLFGAFEINGVNLTSQGLWARPDQNTHRYTELSYWTELAKLLDRGGFDFLFLADSYGYPSLEGETPPVAFEQAVEIPKNDPMLLVPALAAATDQLMFAVTTSTSFEAPFANARRFATLDHLTKGRIGWNVVTTSSAVVTDLFGRDRYVPHDERYAIAQEYLDLSYALLEGSWEDDAVKADKVRRLYAVAEKVHKIHHHGRYFDLDGYFNCEPSPQRTPVLIQAGASSTGRAFAAGNAEITFLQGKDTASLRSQVDDLRGRAVEAGRAADAIKAVVGLSVVVNESEARARARLDDYLSWVDVDAARAYYASMTGIDLATLDPDASFSSVQTEGGRTQVERYRGSSAREAAADFLRYGMREFILTGTPTQVADRIEELVGETGVDGFNFTPFVSPGSYEQFIELVLPELRRRGLAAPLDRQPGTFRKRLTGADRLPASHPADRFRRSTQAAAVGS
ncbi:MAG: NtaA/DmoA family FMN-dependent monooxygenase [Acidobacteria bacterium]|nr:NtaA/DmoA family FMN-dependent monooxygenase [Acidobacteriota bacterium]